MARERIAIIHNMAMGIYKCLTYLPRYLGQEQISTLRMNVRNYYDVAKLSFTDRVQKMIDKAVQLHNGNGIRSSPNAEELHRVSTPFIFTQKHRTSRNLS